MTTARAIPGGVEITTRVSEPPSRPVLETTGEDVTEPRSCRVIALRIARAA